MGAIEQQTPDVFDHYSFFLQRELPNLDHHLAKIMQNKLNITRKSRDTHHFAEISRCATAIFERQPEVIAASKGTGGQYKRLVKAMVVRPEGATTVQIKVVSAARETLGAIKNMIKDNPRPPAQALGNALAVFVCLMCRHDPNNAEEIFAELTDTIVGNVVN